MRVYTLSCWVPGHWPACFPEGVEHRDGKGLTVAQVAPEDWLVCVCPRESLGELEYLETVVPWFRPERRVLMHYENRYMRPRGYRLRFQAQFGWLFTSCSDAVDDQTVMYFPIVNWLRSSDIIAPSAGRGHCAMVSSSFGYHKELREKIFFDLRLRHREVPLYGVSDIPLEPRWDFRAKIRVLSKYRFNLAIENARDLGHVTEKIFDAMAAGCVPVYLGAPDVTNIVPSACFVDYRDFWDLDEALHYCVSMSKEEYLARAGTYAALLPTWLNMRHVGTLIRWALSRTGLSIVGPVEYKVELDALSALVASSAGRIYGGGL